MITNPVPAFRSLLTKNMVDFNSDATDLVKIWLAKCGAFWTEINEADKDYGVSRKNRGKNDGRR
jgi:hypothetical protein